MACLLDRAIHYLLDGDAQPDPIWLLRVRHPVYEPSGDACVSGATDGCIYQSDVFTASTLTVNQKVGAAKGKGRERVRRD